MGVDVGGTNLRRGIVDRDLQLTGFKHTSTRQLLQGENAGTSLVTHIAAWVRQMPVAPVGVAIGVPSIVDKSRRVVIQTTNIAGMDNFPLAQMVEDALGLPTFINRDTNMLLLNDIHALGLEHESVVIGCYPGTGFGNGIWINGQLHTGRNGVEGELGHIPAYGVEQRCGCGNRGCVETIAAGLYLESLMERHFPGEAIAEVFVRHGGSPVLAQFIDNIALPIATEVNILDPDAVIIGGGVPSMRGFPKRLLEERIRLHTRKPQPSEGLRIRYARPRQSNGVVGAGIYAFDRLDRT